MQKKTLRGATSEDVGVVVNCTNCTFLLPLCYSGPSFIYNADVINNDYYYDNNDLSTFFCCYFYCFCYTVCVNIRVSRYVLLSVVVSFSLLLLFCVVAVYFIRCGGTKPLRAPVRNPIRAGCNKLLAGVITILLFDVNV